MPVPDVWRESMRRASERDLLEHRRSPIGRRILVIAAAMAVTASIAVILEATFRPSVRGPVASPEPTAAPVADVQLGSSVRLPMDPSPEGPISSFAEGFGSIWVVAQFEEPGVNQLRRLDPETGAVQAVFSIPVSGGAEWGGDGVVVGDGAVWATSWKDATLFEIDPADDSVQRFSFDGRVVGDIAIDQGTGALWVPVLQKEQGWRLLRVDPLTGAELSSIEVSTDFAGGLLPLQGTVWQLGRNTSHSTVMGGYLHQVTPGTAADVPIGGTFSWPVTDGRWIWTATSKTNEVVNLADGIAMIDPTTGAVDQSWSVGGIGYDVAVGPDGGIWFLGARGLERLNPTTGSVQARPTSGTPVLVYPSRGGVWMGTYEGDIYFRRLTVGDVPPLSFSNATGWESRAYSHPKGADPNLAWTTNEPAAITGRPARFPGTSLSSLDGEGIAIIAWQIGGAGGLDPLTHPDAHPTVDRFQLTPPSTAYEGQVSPDVSRSQMLAWIHGRLVQVDVYFGSLDPSADVLANAQAALDRLVVTAAP
jgi:hypothetical protein